ncbi:response regulator [Vibrio sp. ZSDE26]|uniref:Response regulator n=1 Tax=Vibrio amylolyticus TaxID=2847292 RepID=A0A9X1XKB5_9VIBR|nr:response regulator [Vibrio amylolyticus]
MQPSTFLLKSIKTLVIDDSSMYRVSAREMLIKLGFTASDIVFAQDGKQAVSHCREQSFDLVLCDYNLGVAPDGYDLLDQLKEECLLPPSCVLVIITGDGSSEVVRGFSELEPDGYLLKPISFDILKERLPKLISRKFKLRTPLDLINQGKYEEAVEEADVIMFEGGDIGFNAQLLKAKAYMLSGQLDLARNLLVSLKSPNKPSVIQLELAELAFQQRNYSLCEYLLETFSGTKFASPLDLKAKLAFAKGDYGQSIEFLELAISMSPKSVVRYALLTFCYIARLDLSDAVEAQKKLVKRAKRSFRYDIEMIQLGSSLYLDHSSLTQTTINPPLLNELPTWLGEWRDNFPRTSYQYFELLCVARAHLIQSNNNKATTVYEKYQALLAQREEPISLMEQIESVKISLLLRNTEQFELEYEKVKVSLNRDKDNNIRSSALLLYLAKWTTEVTSLLEQYDTNMELSREYFTGRDYEEAILRAIEAMKVSPVGNVEGSIHTLRCLSKAWPIGMSKKEVLAIFNANRDAVIGCDFVQTAEYKSLMKKMLDQFNL